jgi:hypothetical protein
LEGAGSSQVKPVVEGSLFALQIALQPMGQVTEESLIRLCPLQAVAKEKAHGLRRTLGQRQATEPSRCAQDPHPTEPGLEQDIA